MRLRLPFFLLAFLLAQIVWAENIPCRVVGVTDGDTVTCLTSEKRQIKVRLAQIDAPEKGQPFGQRSKQTLSDFVFQKDVVLKSDGADRYGRTIATIYVAGRDVNLLMLKRGMAWVYDRYAHDESYFAAHKASRLNRVGLWADPSPMPPQEWRRKK